MTEPEHSADTVVMEPFSGIVRNRSTTETQVWLDGRLIGACALGVPKEAWQRWLAGIVANLTPEEIVKVYSPGPGAGRLDVRGASLRRITWGHR